MRETRKNEVCRKFADVGKGLITPCPERSMPRKYVRGQKQRTDAPGSACESCTATTSSGWSKGVCASCRVKAARDGADASRSADESGRVLGDVSNLLVDVERVLGRGDYAGAAFAAGMPAWTERPPVEQATVVQATVVAEPMEELQPRAVAAAEQRAAAGEKRAAAAEAHVVELQAKLERVLCTTRDRLLATAHEEDSIPVERLGRYTGLSVDELMPHRRAMQLLFMAYPEEQKTREFWMYSPED